MSTTPELDPAALARRAAEELAEGLSCAWVPAVVAIAVALAEREPEPLPPGAKPFTIDPLDAYRMWLEAPGNGDALCTCGHQYRAHLADLSGCSACTKWEPPSHACAGFNLDRSTR